MSRCHVLRAPYVHSDSARGCPLPALTSRSHLVESEPVSIDLSEATRLKSVVFRIESWLVGWIVVALRTITSDHRDLREISIYASHRFDGNIRGFITRQVANRQWSDLDRVLVQLWESHSIRPRIGHAKLGGRIARFLPDAAKRGIIDLINSHGPQ